MSFTRADDDDFISQGETSTQVGTETHLLLKVPNYNGSTDEPLTSYLRLGAVDPSVRQFYSNLAAGQSAVPPPQSGEDLAKLVTSFLDDTRYRGYDADPYYRYTLAERQALTGQLHLRGGWRDHSDGNRVSTTRGDKVEVIQGNYRLVVLGRRQGRVENSDDGTRLDASAEHEISGGVHRLPMVLPGNLTDVRWVRDPYDGTWRVTEEALKGDTHRKYHGVVKEEFFGRSVESTVGAEIDGDELPGVTHKARTCPTCGREYRADVPGEKAEIKLSLSIVFPPEVIALATPERKARWDGYGGDKKGVANEIREALDGFRGKYRDKYEFAAGEMMAQIGGRRFLNKDTIILEGYDDYIDSWLEDVANGSRFDSDIIASTASGTFVAVEVGVVPESEVKPPSLVSSMWNGWSFRPSTVWAEVLNPSGQSALTKQGADPRITATHCEDDNTALDAEAPLYDPIREWTYLWPAGKNPRSTVLHKDRPVVTERTWAKSVESYLGSAITPVDSETDHSWVGGTVVKSYRGSTTPLSRSNERHGPGGYDRGTIRGETWADRIEDYTGSDNWPVRDIVTATWATYIDDTIHADTIFNSKWASVQEMWFGAFAEMFAGARISGRIGASVDFFLAVALEVFLLNKNEVFIGGKLGLTVGPQVSYNVGMRLELGTAKTYNSIAEVKTAMAERSTAAVIFKG